MNFPNTKQKTKNFLKINIKEKNFSPKNKVRCNTSKIRYCIFPKNEYNDNCQEEILTIREEGYGGAEITDKVLTIFSLDFSKIIRGGAVSP